MLFITTIDGGFLWLAVAAAANTVASLYFYARVMGRVYFGTPIGDVAVLGRLSGLAVWVAAIAVLLSVIPVETALSVFGMSRLLPL